MSPREHRRRLRAPRPARAPLVRSGSAVLLAVVVMAAYPTVGATFTATTGGSANTFSAGTVQLGDDDVGVAMFNPATLTPSTPAVKCIAVTYSGTASSAVRLYATVGGTASVYPYVTVTIEEGTGGSSTDCSGFSASSTLVSSALNAWTATSYATGLSSWAPAATQTRTYRFTASLSASTPSNQSGLSVTLTPTWEARAGT